jgi:hypothetical protein
MVCVTLVNTQSVLEKLRQDVYKKLHPGMRWSEKKGFIPKGSFGYPTIGQCGAILVILIFSQKVIPK